MIVDRLVAILGLETDSQSFNKARKEISKLRSVLKVAAAAGAALSVAFASAANTFAAEADSMVKHARKINIAVEALQEIQFAGERSGISLQTTNTALQRLQRRISTASRGMGPAVGVLAELNLNAKELNNLQTDQQLERIIGALSRKPKTEWNRILTALADIEGTEFSKLVEGGLPALRALRKEANKLGGVFSEQQAKDAEAYQDAMFNLRWTLTGIRNLLSSEIIPSVTKALSTATSFISENRDGVMFLVKGVGFIIGALSVLVFGKTAIVGGIIGGLLLALEDVYSFFKGKESITGLIVNEFNIAFGKVEKAWDKLLDKFKAKFKEYKDKIEEMIPDWMKEAWAGVKDVQQTILVNTRSEAANTSLGQKVLQAQAGSPRKSSFAGYGSTFNAQNTRVMTVPTNNVNVSVPLSINGVSAGQVKREIRTEIMIENSLTAKVLSSGEVY